MKTSITSSNIAAADWSNETLTLWFHNGGVYSYADVPMSVFNDFIHAESQGKFFHAFIKSSYVATRNDAVAAVVHDGGG